MKTLYLHIGTHKTGTSAIQQFCTLNNEKMEQHGFSYPDFGFRYLKRNAQRNGLWLTTYYWDENNVRHPEVEDERFLEVLRIVNEKFKTCDTVILSDEAIWRNFYITKFMRFHQLMEDARKNGYEVKVVIYLRRQDSFVESWWNQIIKGSQKETITFQDFLKDAYYLDYYGILSAYADEVGEENLIVRRFRDAVKGPGIVADFMNIVGLEITDEYEAETDEVNTGLYGNLVEIKRIINQSEGLIYMDNPLIRYGLGLSAGASKAAYPCSEFSEEERTEFMKQFEEDNQKIVDRFIKDDQPLFPLDYSGPPKRQNDNPEFLNDVIRGTTGITVLLYRELLKTNAELLESNRTIKELEKELRRHQKAMDRMQTKLESHDRRLEHLRHPLKTITNKITGNE